MEKIETFVNEARFLESRLRTIWSEYDFNEVSSELTKRVPDINFELDSKIEKVSAEVFRQSYDFFLERYTRKCQFVYNGRTYIFEISTCVEWDCVKGYYIEVYTPSEDKNNDLVLLLEKPLTR